MTADPLWTVQARAEALREASYEELIGELERRFPGFAGGEDEGAPVPEDEVRRG